MRRIFTLLVLLSAAVGQTGRVDINGQVKAKPVTDTGTTNTYAVSMSSMGTSYYTGMPVVFTAAHANAGASTLNVNSLGTKAIKKQGGTQDLAANDIQANAVILVIYDGTNFQMQTQTGNNGGGSDAGACPSHEFETADNASAAPTCAQPAAADLSDGTTGTGTVVRSISPALTGSPTAPTQASSDSTSKIATTAFCQSIANAPASPVQSGAWGTVDAPPSSPTAYDDEFNGGALAAQWSWVNQGSATATVGKGVLSLFVPAASGDNERGIVETLPAAPYQFDAKINVQLSNNSFPVGGMSLYDGTKIMTIGVAWNGNNNCALVTTQNSITASYSVSASWGCSSIAAGSTILYVRVKDDGTNLTWSICFDGVSWRQLLQASRTAFFSSGPTKIGFLGESNNSSNSLFVGVDWIRRTL